MFNVINSSTMNSFATFQGRRKIFKDTSVFQGSRT